MEASALDRSLLVAAAAAAPAPTVADPPLGGPISPGLDVLLCILPVAFLLAVTLSKRLFLPTARSLPWAAFMMWSIKMCWIGENPIHITATVMQGALLALTPLSILFSAFVFFNALTTTNTLAYMAALVRALCCNHPVAEVMLVLWAIGHLIEGAAGFGTGPAMLPPIMAALGHAPFESVVCLLIMTTCVGPFGSSGIGLWFGLSALDWSRAQLVHVTFLVSICMTVMSFPICWLGARFLLTWRDVRGCWLFCALSVAACALPMLLASLFSFEAPGLLSGVLGTLITGLLARKQLGLSQQVPCALARRAQDLEGALESGSRKVPDAFHEGQPPGFAGSPGGGPGGAGTAAYLADRRQLAARLAPWACMLAVVAGTRASYLQHSNGRELTLHLRSLGDLSISSNLVISFHDLCRIFVNWSYALLYVPALLPFVCTACATLLAFRHSIPPGKSWRDPFAAATAKCKGVAPAIIGALILVALMVQGGRQAPSYIIGYWLSEWLGRGYIAVSQLLGAVGSFFSGSVATSNMTFGLLQQVAAKKLGLNATAMVMLQIVGGAAGQMISISNILGGRAVMGLQHVPEGRFVQAALPACFAYYVAGTLLALPFLFM
ncbi:hypothetical protein ABPG77_011418 [Micractinium sp. CCAP 211/92]